MAASRRAANAVSKDVQTCFCIISNYVRSLWCINYFFSSSKNRHIKSIAITCLVRRPGNLSEIRKTPYLLRWSTSVLCTCSLKEFCNSRKKTYRVVVLSHNCPQEATDETFQKSRSNIILNICKKISHCESKFKLTFL